MKRYDYLLVGSGLFSAVFANEMRKRGKKCIVIEKRNHIGGNIYCEKINDINVHKYGAHIFHTNDKDVWNYVNDIVEFNRFTNSPVANYKGEIYNLPFNMNTFSKLWGIRTPDEAKDIISKQKSAIKGEPKNLEEQAISLVGMDIYEKLIKGYTEKQWGRSCKDLPSFIIKRIPVRYTYDNNYFNDKYQGIPIGGYNILVERLFEGCDIELEKDYLDNKKSYDELADRVVYTGTIDRYYGYCYGKLEYRSLRFETEKLETDNYQGVAVVNYTEREIPYTRIIEHKHFEFGTQNNTIITKEYPMTWSDGMEPYYPVNNEINQEIYKKYEGLSKQDSVIFGGRLAEYKYYDMDKVIVSALMKSKEILDEDKFVVNLLPVEVVFFYQINDFIAYFRVLIL